MKDINKQMESFFIELQNCIAEGSDYDLKNEECHLLNEYIGSLNKKIEKTKCCYSCKWYNFMLVGECPEGREEDHNLKPCDNWQLKENIQNEV